MKHNVRRKLDASRRRVMKRIDKANWNGQSPMIATLPVKYEFAIVATPYVNTFSETNYRRFKPMGDSSENSST